MKARAAGAPAARTQIPEWKREKARQPGCRAFRIRTPLGRADALPDGGSYFMFFS